MTVTSPARSCGCDLWPNVRKAPVKVLGSTLERYLSSLYSYNPTRKSTCVRKHRSIQRVRQPKNFDDMASILCLFICCLLRSALIAGGQTTNTTSKELSSTENTRTNSTTKIAFTTTSSFVTNGDTTTLPNTDSVTASKSTVSTLTTVNSSTINSTSSASEMSLATEPTSPNTSLTSVSTTSTSTTTAMSSNSQSTTSTHAATHITSLAPSTSSSTVIPTKPPTNPENITVSETNLLLANDNFFIELSGRANISLHGFTLAVYDTITELSVWNITFSANDSLSDEGLHVQNITDAPDMQGAVAVVLFQTSGFGNNISQSENSIVSYLMFSSNSSSVHPVYREVLPMSPKNFLTVVNKMKLHVVSSVSMSHCDAFPYPTLTRSSPGKENICSFPKDLSAVYMVMLKKEEKFDCSKIEPNFSNQLITNISEKCQCSVNPGLFLDSKSSCGDNRSLKLTFTFQAAVPEQLRSFNESYHDCVTQSRNILVDGKQFELVMCGGDACDPPHEPTGKNNDTSVTAAVVLSCIAVFCVVLIAVIIYMRRKRRSTLQFRMSRLNEDDDMIGDMDDFIGSSDNNEPSFTNSQYNLTR